MVKAGGPGDFGQTASASELIVQVHGWEVEVVGGSGKGKGVVDVEGLTAVAVAVAAVAAVAAAVAVVAAAAAGTWQTAVVRETRGLSLTAAVAGTRQTVCAVDVR